MIMQRVVVLAISLIAAGSASAQEAKKPPRAVEAERVDTFLERHAQADPSWAARQCLDCHVVPREQRPTLPTNKVRFSLVALNNLESRSLEGLTVAPVDDMLRQHLKIPDHQGLVVTSVDPSSPSHTAGVFVHDILLKVDDKPITNAKDLVRALRGADDKPVLLTLMHQGLTKTIRVMPEVRIALRSAGPETPDLPKHWIGVGVGPIEPALRAQLKGLDSMSGLSVSGVHAASPAAKAGIKSGDILLSLDSKPIASALDLRQRVEAAGARPIELRYLHDGEQKTVKVSPEPFKPETSAVGIAQPLNSAEVYFRLPQMDEPSRGADRFLFVPKYDTFTDPNIPAPNSDLSNRLNALDAEMREVRSSLQKIEQALGKLGAVQKK